MGKKLCLIFSSVLLIFFLSGCLAKKKTTPEPFTIIHLGSPIMMDLDQLIQGADAIAIGEVVSFNPSRWNTKNGKLPFLTSKNNIPSNLTIFTDVNFHISQALKGSLAEENVRVRTFRGQVGKIRITSELEPNYSIGTSYLIFLVHDSGSTAEIEPGDFITYGVQQGVYEISGDKAICQYDQSQWNLEELIDKIKQGPVQN